MTDHAQRFHHQLERVRLRAMRAVERYTPSPDEAVLRRLANQLLAIDAAIAEPRPRDRAVALARRLGSRRTSSS